MKVFYLDGLRTEFTNERGMQIQTQETFFPTDLFALSLASCMLTCMGIKAKQIAFDLKGTIAEVQKEMTSKPNRHIGKIVVRIQCPQNPQGAAKKSLEQAALECPVHNSLHPSVQVEVDFTWGTGAI